jgi:hypothetical protein
MSDSTTERRRVNIPVPDPTTLTTEQLRVGLGSLRELLETRVAGLETLVKRLAQELDRVPGDSAAAVAAMERLMAERLANIMQQMVDFKAMVAQAATAGKTAIDAAFAAQEKTTAAINVSNAIATAKAESNTTKQIDNMGVQLAALGHANDDKIADVKERLDRGEGADTGARRSKAERLSDHGDSVTTMGVAIAGLALVLTLLSYIALHVGIAPGSIVVQAPPPAPLTMAAPTR